MVLLEGATHKQTRTSTTTTNNTNQLPVKNCQKYWRSRVGGRDCECWLSHRIAKQQCFYLTWRFLLFPKTNLINLWCCFGAANAYLCSLFIRRTCKLLDRRMANLSLFRIFFRWSNDGSVVSVLLIKRTPPLFALH